MDGITPTTKSFMARGHRDPWLKTYQEGFHDKVIKSLRDKIIELEARIKELEEFKFMYESVSK